MNLLSEIDSNRFGFPVGKASWISAEVVESVISQSKSEGLRLLIARCPTDDWATVHSLERHGFLLMDTLVYLRHVINAVLPMATGEALIRAARTEDSEVVSTVARKAFVGYRGHYNTDSRLNQTVVAEIYPSWAESTVTDKSVADEVLVAEIGGRIVGFGAMKILGKGVTDGLLYGVAPEFRRRGVFRDLILASLQWGKDRGQNAMDYSTQLTNTAALSSIARLGFVPQRSLYTFHLWLE